MASSEEDIRAKATAGPGAFPVQICTGPDSFPELEAPAARPYLPRSRAQFVLGFERAGAIASAPANKFFKLLGYTCEQARKTYYTADTDRVVWRDRGSQLLHRARIRCDNIAQLRHRGLTRGDLVDDRTIRCRETLVRAVQYPRNE